MPVLRLSWNLIVGFMLFLLVSSDVVNHDPVLFSTSLDPPQSSQPLDMAEQNEMISLDSEGPAAPGLVGGSHESGFSSEEAEEPKTLQSHYSWDEGGEVNVTNLDPDSPEGDSQASFQPSSSPAETTSDLNSSSPVVPLGESLDPDLWEIQGETSGSPVEPVYGLPTTDSVSLTHTTSTDSDAGLVREWGHNDSQETALPDSTATLEEEQLSHTHTAGSTQPTTVAGVAALPGGDRLHPDYSPTDESEVQDVATVLTAVQEGGEEDGLDSSESLVHHTPLTTVPSSSPSSSSLPDSVAFTDVPWREVSTTGHQGQQPELRHGGTDFFSEADFMDKHPPHESLQVICVDWRDLTGKGYVILNMSENFECDEFRVESGDRLLEMLETAFSRKMNSPQGSWLISLSKPTRQDRQLLMTLASEQGVIATKDVLSMLGEIRRGLHDIGIQNYTSVTSCQSRPSQTRSDYGKLFVVLVIIGSICVVIIASGLIYICWQRRLPKMKNMSRGEELHFVENGCHDNPTLDVTSDSQSEMLEKKHSANGVMAGGGSSSGWQVLVNKPGKEEAENLEEDTHL
ncbi:podocalyxin-like protein 2 [Megalops cyprinoides]|uniref:podocalyxin-like protein 2 n=1 Tax=Megalops cyprinoides TaxID=118141 RepID=UPI001863D33A|nr:podocalyxin-like protein 2 [Megalops cyprinoides]